MFFIKNKILIILLFAVAALCAAFFISEDITAHREMAEYMKLESAYTKMYTPIHEQSATGTPNETAYLPYLEVDFGSLLETNPETVGWLAIPGTVISYPVVQADDNIKYLNTSFYGERSGTGAIFMDSGNAVNPLDQNTIIYGHHIAGREDMFGTLLYYSDQSYYDAHQWIQFDTIHKQYGWWRIFAVIQLDVKAGIFDCYKQNFIDAAELEAWISQAKELSLYDTGVQIPVDAHILTLSTCNRSIGYGRNGRQLILAVQTSGQLGPK